MILLVYDNNSKNLTINELYKFLTNEDILAFIEEKENIKIDKTGKERLIAWLPTIQEIRIDFNMHNSWLKILFSSCYGEEAKLYNVGVETYLADYVERWTHYNRKITDYHCSSSNLVHECKLKIMKETGETSIPFDEIMTLFDLNANAEEIAGNFIDAAEDDINEAWINWNDYISEIVHDGEKARFRPSVTKEVTEIIFNLKEEYENLGKLLV